MQMELILVFAAATGRTLVLPPDQPMYLLNKGIITTGAMNVINSVNKVTPTQQQTQAQEPPWMPVQEPPLSEPQEQR